MKKVYVTPEVIVHGTVEDITQISHFRTDHRRRPPNHPNHPNHPHHPRNNDPS